MHFYVHYHVNIIICKAPRGQFTIIRRYINALLLVVVVISSSSTSSSIIKMSDMIECCIVSPYNNFIERETFFGHTVNDTMATLVFCF